MLIGGSNATATNKRKTRPHWSGLIRALSLSVVVAVAASGCSALEEALGSGNDRMFLVAGQDLIEDELADQIGLGPLNAVCSGQNLQAGDSFECSATAGQLTPIQFSATINEDGQTVVLDSTNLLLAAQVEQVEDFAAGLLSDQTTRTVNPDDFECGDSSVVISSGEVLDCVVTDPADGTRFEAPVAIENLDELAITVNIGNIIP